MSDITKKLQSINPLHTCTDFEDGKCVECGEDKIIEHILDLPDDKIPPMPKVKPPKIENIGPLQQGDMIVYKIDMDRIITGEELTEIRKRFIKINQLEDYNVIIIAKGEEISILSRK